MADREVEKWVTIRGHRVPIYKKNGIVEALHFTSRSNAESILSSGFDLGRSGEQSPTKKKFSTFGNAIYFTNGEEEDRFYSEARTDGTAIQANIDTSKMIEVNLGEHPVKSYDDMYQTIISQLPKNIQREYDDYMKSHGLEQRSKAYISSEAFSVILPRYYSGLIIKQKQSKDFDYISGGNQIVVYDPSAITDMKIRSK